MPELDFSSVLASSVHDMKNSLGLLLQTVENLEERAEEPLDQRQKHYQSLRYEAMFLNQQMVQLLTLYKLDRRLYSPNIESWPLAEILEEVALQHAPLFVPRGLDLNWDCSADLDGFCDRELVGGVLGHALHNALRHARNGVRLSAAPQAAGQGVVLLVEDDGKGFPEHALLPEDAVARAPDFASGSTSLGLYFSQLIARLHCSRGISGHLLCDNDSRLGGARFALYLP